MAEPDTQYKFPDNAYRELKPGESYVPMVPPGASVPEITTRTIVFGLLMNIVFSVAATFLALKAGQGIETAIPISILAVGLSGFLLKAGMRASSILENVYVLAISTTSGYVAGGTCFTMPAIYILSLDTNLGMSTTSLFFQISLVPFLGAILGIIFLIPFRRYFVKEMHGKLPFPEATATNEILVTGASGSTGQAWVLIYTFILSAVYTFLATGLRLFSDTFTTGLAKLEALGKPTAEALAFGDTGLFATLSNKIKAVLAMGAGAYYLGLGFIIGIRYASIICAGSFLSCFAIIPLLGQLDLEDLQRLNPSVKAMTGPTEETPRFELPTTFGAKLDEFGKTWEQRDLPEQVRANHAGMVAAFGQNGVALVSNADVYTTTPGEEWRIYSDGKLFVLKTREAAIAVYDDDAAQPSFTVAAAFAGKLDQFDLMPGVRTELGEAFGQNGVALVSNADVHTTTPGEEWRIDSDGQLFVLKTTEAAIAVYEKKGKPPSFTIKADFAAQLDEFDLMPGIRAELGEAFAGQDHAFLNEKVGITVKEAGHEWHLTDKQQAYVLKVDDAARIAVFAREASAQDIFGEIPKNIGIGAIFTAGLLSIIKMFGVIVTALRKGLGSLFRKDGAATASLDRTDEDISYPTMMILGLLAVVVMAVFFRFGVLSSMESPTWLMIVSVVLVLVIAFLFTTVSAWAIAMISVTPISGMTVTTIIITAFVLSVAGLSKGDGGMLATLLVGGVVCTALSLAGGLVTNFKLGYWLGGSPKKIAWCALVGSLVSAIFVCGTIMVLAYKPGYTGGDLPAPQANMMASALESFLGTGEVPWLLYGVGVVIALTVELIGISALAFGLGMYLPMYINTPILIGAFVAWLVKKSAKGELLSKVRVNKGILIASGLIAGGAIMEVLVNFTAALDDQLLGFKAMVGGHEETVGIIMPFLDMSGRMIDGGINPESLARTQNWLGFVLFILLCLFVYWDCRRAKADEAGPSLAE